MHSKDLAFCWEKVLISDPWFRLKYAFAPKGIRNQLLGVHALFAMIDQSLSKSDEKIVMAQLSWWQSELIPECAAVSNHPVIRVMRESGATSHLHPNFGESLIGQALYQLSTPLISRTEDLKSACNTIGHARMSVLSSISSECLGGLTLRAECQGSGFCCLLRSAIASGSTELWFVPLEMQAKYSCSSQEMFDSNAQSVEIWSALSDLAVSWFDRQLVNLAKELSGEESVPKGARYLLATTLVERLWTMRSLETMPESPLGRSVQWGVGEFLGVWRKCRKLLRMFS